MSESAIRVEGLSKRYRIGLREVMHDTLTGALVAWLKTPFSKYKQLNKLSTFSQQDEEDVIWALKDVSFTVKYGEVVGIIGHNGAGKSTLLKILSKITEPSSGRAVLEGRVASLLEVGTGFHTELTGRENVYLNGTILGMTKAEVDRKFDEMVDFSGVEKFIDTPVKRYSSGMQVRLAFSVAAHLEPEILLIDEVLAVGDAAFQKRCLGRMDTLAKEGRTILFVSHDMGAITHLCSETLLLEHGGLVARGASKQIVEQYLKGTHADSRSSAITLKKTRPGDTFWLTKAHLQDAAGSPVDLCASGQRLIIALDYDSVYEHDIENMKVILSFYDRNSVLLFSASTVAATHERFLSIPSRGRLRCDIAKLPLIPGEYYVSLVFQLSHGEPILAQYDGLVNMTVIEGNFFDIGRNMGSGDTHARYGSILVEHTWSVVPVDDKVASDTLS